MLGGETAAQVEVLRGREPSELPQLMVEVGLVVEAGPMRDLRPMDSSGGAGARATYSIRQVSRHRHCRPARSGLTVNDRSGPSPQAPASDVARAHHTPSAECEVRSGCVEPWAAARQRPGAMPWWRLKAAAKENSDA